jgi:TldD protein
MSDLRDLEEEFFQALKRLARRTKFAELLAQSSEGQGFRLERRQTSVSQNPRLKGAVLRAWGGRRWVEVATSALDGRSVTLAVEALEQTLWKTGSGPDPPGRSATTQREWSERPPHPMREAASEDLIAFSKDVLGWATAVPGIREASVQVAWSDEERLYLNTAGARCYQLLCRVYSVAAPLAIENGRVEVDAAVDGGLGGRDRLKALSQESVTAAAQSAVKLLHARAPPSGEMTVLLDPSTSGTFAHESFGHGTEADQFLRDRSYLKPILGQVVGPETLTIVDDGAYPDGWGTIHFDDEGNLGQRTLLVDKGRFVGALHDRETAAAFHVPPTGNARRSDFLSREYVRMTNTCVEPGNWTFDELVQEAKNGVLLERATSGIEDPQGGQMQLKVKKGRKIENGQLTDLVTSMALSGRVLDFLRSVRGVSHRSDFHIDPGTCGKGQSDLLPAGTGGTYLLSTAIVGRA